MGKSEREREREREADGERDRREWQIEKRWPARKEGAVRMHKHKWYYRLGIELVLFSSLSLSSSLFLVFSPTFSIFLVSELQRLSFRPGRSLHFPRR